MMSENQEIRSLLRILIKAWKPDRSGDPAKQRATCIQLLELLRQLIAPETERSETYPPKGNAGAVQIIQESEASETLRHLQDALKRLDKGMVEPIFRPTREADRISHVLTLEDEQLRETVVTIYDIMREREPHRSATEIKKDIAERLNIQPLPPRSGRKSAAGWKRVDDWVKRHKGRKDYS